MVDWQILATIAAPILALLIGALINRWFENRPKLLSHWGHVSSFNYHDPAGNINVVNTHSVVIRNAGKQAATNVRLSHSFLPEFNIFPPIKHQVEDVSNIGPDILIPTIVPGEEITISYLYFPPYTYAQINAGVKFDEGFAKQIPVLLQQQYPRWVRYIRLSLVLTGVSTLLYVLYELGTVIGVGA